MPVVFPISGGAWLLWVVQPIARQIGLTTLGTLHERIGDTLTVGNASPGAEGWLRSAGGRVIGQQIDNHYQAFPITFSMSFTRGTLRYGGYPPYSDKFLSKIPPALASVRWRTWRLTSLRGLN